MMVRSWRATSNTSSSATTGSNGVDGSATPVATSSTTDDETRRRSRYKRLFGAEKRTDEPTTESEAVEDRAPIVVTDQGSKFATFSKWSRKVVAAVVVVAVFVALGIGAVALANGSWSVNPVLSGSMRPGFSVGGVAISEKVPVNQLAVRDVIVFREPSNPSVEVVHRIVQMTKSKTGELLIRTRGDENNVRDPWTLTIRGNYAYKVRWSLPLLGYVAAAYQNHRGVTLLVAGLLLIAVAATTVLQSRRRGEGRPKARPSPGPDEPVEAE